MMPSKRLVHTVQRTSSPTRPSALGVWTIAELPTLVTWNVTQQRLGGFPDSSVVGATT